MGAIFLYNTLKNINTENALKHFEEAGFSDPVIIDIGIWRIYAYSKMCGHFCNIVSHNEVTLISVGTSVYKGMGYTEGLYALLKDYIENKIIFNKLIGHYNIFFCHKDTIDILFDPQDSKHLFVDQDLNVISPHMLAICQCLPGKLNVRKESVYEKLLTGIIMSPNTIFENVLQFNPFVKEKVEHSNTGISFITPTNDNTNFLPRKIKRNQCIKEQAESLLQYFSYFKKQGAKGVDAGLSGGYDSRLILACMNRILKPNIHLHTHSTENVHKNDLTIAFKMADYINVPCNVVRTNKLEHCEDVKSVIRNSILYFDGRSSYSIGGCGEVYTAKYRIKSTENTPFSLTGVGGELYRNAFCLNGNRFYLDHFLKEKIFSYSFSKALPKSIYDYMSDIIFTRTAERLGLDRNKRQFPLSAYRYYCEIMMPEGQGTALDAYNQVSCCVAPFIDKHIIFKGYESIKFHGAGGDFEGDLIGYIDPGLASIESSYGYPLNKRTIKAKIKESIRTVFPSTIWSSMSDLIHFKKRKETVYSFDASNSYGLIMKEAFLFFHKLFPEININMLLKSEEDLRRIQFLAMTLLMFKERICLSE